MEGSFAVNDKQGDQPQGAHEPGRRLTPEEAKSRRSRNVAIAIGICFLIVLFYVVTIAKLGVGVVVRPGI
ncbi:MAG: hypothetical protein Q8M31_09710 [Beijerinckiaceae bacterium]|nr:hypothetical protein [Beijerinckiaceae bacterium]